MILPVVSFGDPVLRKVAKEIDKDHQGLKELIDNMFETMYAASGVGLAAPQIGQSIRLFILDASPFAEKEEEDEKPNEHEHLKGFKKIFINAKIIEEEGKEWKFNEGCLSIPTIREDVMRMPKIRIQYMDENFKKYEEEYDGIAARIIQHEYDHIEGKLFTDRINPLRKRLLKNKLTDISKGRVEVSYKMKFSNK